MASKLSPRPTPILLGALFCFVLGTSGPTLAEQTRPAVKQPAITDQDLESARKRFRAPSEAELRAAMPSTPNVDALPAPSPGESVDIEAMAKRFSANGNDMAAAQGLLTTPSLLVFISLSMPEPTLNRLVEQASRAKAVLILRGLQNGSIRETAQQMQRLIGSRQVAAQIDPRQFDRFSVVRVPTFVLVKGGVNTQQCNDRQCLPSSAYAALTGDVSVDYALEYIARTSTRFVPEARRFLAQFRGESP